MQGLQEAKAEVLRGLSLVEDRCDKVGNKASVIERRLEGLVFDLVDCERHCLQVLEAFNPLRSASEEWPKAQLEALQAKWTQARRRLGEVCNAKAWQALVSKVKAEGKAMAVWQAEKATEALAGPGQWSKDELEEPLKPRGGFQGGSKGPFKGASKGLRKRLVFQA